jgi:hypothetical protein
MEIKLRHPAFGVRVGMDLCIALISLATVAVLLLRLEAHTRAWLLAGGFVLIGVGSAAFFRNIRGAHFEGFVLIISVALVFQGLLMLTSPRKSKRSDPGSSQLAGSKDTAIIDDSQ